MILLRATVFPYNISDAILGLNTEQLALEEVKVLVYPSGGAGDVTLPLSTFGTNIQNMKVLVANPTGAGTVTVNSATPAGGSAEIIGNAGATSHVLTGGYGSTKFEIVTDGIWVGRDSDV